ncbi:MAG: glycosyltransferase family 2 protein [Acidobacteriota bacterium]
MEPRASIIIVSYNKREDITRCLQSVKETAHAAFEVIVVDNASVDGSADSAARFTEVTVVRSSENLGFGGGCNLGASRARGEHLVFLNPDTTVDPGWLTALTKPLDARADVGLVTSKILMLNDPKRINTCGNTVHLTGLTLCRGLGASSERFNSDEDVDAVSGAAFAIRRDVFESLGGFDETMFLYMEDTDLSLRARLAGWESRFAADSIVYHDYSLKMFPLKVFYQERNRYLMLLKTFRWATLFVMLPALLAAEAITWGFVLLYDRANSRNKLRAYQSVMDNWWMIMRSRRTAQAARKVRDHELLRRTSSKLELENAKQGRLARFAQRIIDPFFYVVRMLTLALVRW